MKKIYLIAICVNFTILSHNYKYDLTIVGYAKFANSLARHVIAQTECLKDHLKINHLTTRRGSDNYLNASPKSAEILRKRDSSPGAVAIFDEMLTYYHTLPNSAIKLSYSMVESTQIPKSWAQKLNDHFDAVVVPDNWLIDVYKNSGVNIPIFVVPPIVYLEEFLNIKPRIQANKPFTFGISATFALNKNIALLIESFNHEFANNNDVRLRIHTPWNYKLDDIKKLINKLNLKNVDLHFGELSWKEYVNFITSLDCYILLSRGEGFSVTPREALAAGIPCIITNNTAHKTICDTGYVCSVKSDISIAHEGEFYGEPCGVNFMCTKEDACAAMLDVYKNYGIYKQKALFGREWVKQYVSQNMRQQYLTLIKPKNIRLSNVNKIVGNTLFTNSESLYKKYKSIMS